MRGQYGGHQCLGRAADQLHLIERAEPDGWGRFAVQNARRVPGFRANYSRFTLTNAPHGAFRQLKEVNRNRL